MFSIKNLPLSTIAGIVIVVHSSVHDHLLTGLFGR